MEQGLAEADEIRLAGRSFVRCRDTTSWAGIRRPAYRDDGGFKKRRLVVSLQRLGASPSGSDRGTACHFRDAPAVVSLRRLVPLGNARDFLTVVRCREKMVRTCLRRLVSRDDGSFSRNDNDCRHTQLGYGENVTLFPCNGPSQARTEHYEHAQAAVSIAEPWRACDGSLDRYPGCFLDPTVRCGGFDIAPRRGARS